MPRSLQEVMDQAEELSAHFRDGFAADATPEVAALRAAARHRSQAETDLASAVVAAIAAGACWDTVGRTTGTSPQAAREAYEQFVVPASAVTSEESAATSMTRPSS